MLIIPPQPPHHHLLTPSLTATSLPEAWAEPLLTDLQAYLLLASTEVGEHVIAPYLFTSKNTNPSVSFVHDVLGFWQQIVLTGYQ